MPNKNSTSKTLDRSLAQSDPKKFIQDNYDEIQSIADIAEFKNHARTCGNNIFRFAAVIFARFADSQIISRKLNSEILLDKLIRAV